MNKLNINVSPELVSELKKRFPSKCPELTATEREIFFYAGKVSLIAFLELQVEEQTEAQMNMEGVNTNVYAK